LVFDGKSPNSSGGLRFSPSQVCDVGTRVWCENAGQEINMKISFLTESFTY
jgi:hypothetical protein